MNLDDRQRLDDIQHRHEQSTPGEWRADDPKTGAPYQVRLGDGTDGPGFRRWRDAEFVAHTHQDIPWLLTVIEQQREIIALLSAHVTGGPDKRGLVWIPIN